MVREGTIAGLKNGRVVGPSTRDTARLDLEMHVFRRRLDMSVEPRQDYEYAVLTSVSQDARGSDDAAPKSRSDDGLLFEHLELMYR